MEIQVPRIINILLIYQYSTNKQFIFRSPHHSRVWQRPCSSSHLGSCSPSPVPSTPLPALTSTSSRLYPWHRWPLDFLVTLLSALGIEEPLTFLECLSYLALSNNFAYHLGMKEKRKGRWETKDMLHCCPLERGLSFQNERGGAFVLAFSPSYDLICLTWMMYYFSNL